MKLTLNSNSNSVPQYFYIIQILFPVLILIGGCSSNIDILLEMSLFGMITILYEATLSFESVNILELILIQVQDLCLTWVRLKLGD